MIGAAVAVRTHLRPGSGLSPRSADEGVAFFAIGITFMTLGAVYSITGQSAGYAWLPIGIVFLAVGARRRRRSRQPRD